MGAVPTSQQSGPRNKPAEPGLKGEVWLGGIYSSDRGHGTKRLVARRIKIREHL